MTNSKFKKGDVIVSYKNVHIVSADPYISGNAYDVGQIRVPVLNASLLEDKLRLATEQDVLDHIERLENASKAKMEELTTALMFVRGGR